MRVQSPTSPRARVAAAAAPVGPCGAVVAVKGSSPPCGRPRSRKPNPWGAPDERQTLVQRTVRTGLPAANLLEVLGHPTRPVKWKSGDIAGVGGAGHAWI